MFETNQTDFFENYTDLIGTRILVAEDNALNQLIARKILEKWQVQFDIVDNGLIAFEKARENSYDIILMDIQMPVLNGFESSLKIREFEQDRTSKTPILALTASVTDDLHEMVHHSGMNGYILKPYTSAILHDTILKTLRA